MKPFTTLLQLCLLITITPFILYSQNDTIPEVKKKKLYFATHLFAGQGFANGYKPEGAFSANVQFQGEERFGFGFDITIISPRSPNFTENPLPSMIVNYTEGVDEPYDNVSPNGVPRQDRFRAYSFYLSKGIKPTNRFVIDFQAGFSLYQMKRNSYTYTYHPRTSGGLFSSGSEPRVYTSRISGSSALDLGVYFRVNGIVRLRKRTVLVLSPFAQLNGKQSFYGIQLGIAFGRKYKLNILK